MRNSPRQWDRMPVLWNDNLRTPEDAAAVNLRSGLNKFRKEGTFCDLVLRIGERRMRVHKIVICVWSPYFKAMFSGNFSESDQREITIKEIDAKSLECLIDYMYTGELIIIPDNVKSLLLTASFLQISKVEELCCKYMLKHMNTKNCIGYLLFAGNNSITSLADSIISKASSSFPYVFSKNEYLELDFEEFKLLTQKVRECLHLEDAIYSFIMRWINHSYETRITFIAELLEILDPVFISPSMLYCSELINTSNPIFTTWAARAKTVRSPNDSGEHILVSRRLGQFPPMRINISSQTIVGKLELLSETITDGSYVCNGYYIYHQGGWIDEQLLDACYTYHPTRREWRPFVRLQEARAYHRSCVLNGTIYSVGGSDGFKALPSVEFIDLLTGQRGLTEPLPRAKERAGLGIHGNCMYVVEGSDRGTAYECVHRFDAREGTWQELSPSPYRTGASSCAVVGENIYTTHPDTLERYDIRANNWEKMSAQYIRYPSEVFAVNNTLFGLFYDHIARFVPDGGTWEYQQSLECNVSYLQVSTNLQIPNINYEEIDEPVGEDDHHDEGNG